MPLEIREDYIRWRLENFWGYGSFDASVWFVGMEEGLSNGGEDYLPPGSLLQMARHWSIYDGV